MFGQNFTKLRAAVHQLPWRVTNKTFTQSHNLTTDTKLRTWIRHLSCHRTSKQTGCMSTAHRTHTGQWVSKV